MSDEHALAIIFGSLAIALVLFLIFYVLQVIAYWKIFKKFGEPGWKAIIPFYNAYIQFKYTWKTSWFWIAIIVAFIGCILQSVGGDGSTLATVGDYVNVIPSIILIVAHWKLSKSFGHGCGWFFGLVFLEIIFILMLGFGKSEYIGNPSNTPKVDEASQYVYAKPQEIPEESPDNTEEPKE